MTLQGKGFFIYNLSDCEGGDPFALAEAARSAGLSHIIIKVADGPRVFGLDENGRDTRVAVIRAFELARIDVWGWHYVYGYDPAGEVQVALQQVNSLGLKGYVLAAEKEFEQPGREVSARRLMEGLRAGTEIPLALNSYGFPNFHPLFPWAAFLELCTYHMPRVFWEQAHNPLEQLLESMRQCDALPQNKPFAACGPAYRTSGWAPLPAEITEFLQGVASQGIPSVDFYHWDHCRKYLDQDWTAISEFSLSSPLPAPKPVPIAAGSTLVEAAAAGNTGEDIAAQFMASLNSRQPTQIAALYDPAAIRTWANQTFYGMLAIRDGYSTVFANLPADITFHLVKARQDDNIHFISWKAGALSGETTLVLKNGRILQDLTFIS